VYSSAQIGNRSDELFPGLGRYHKSEDAPQTVDDVIELLIRLTGGHIQKPKALPQRPG
jgi:hypothetical protein